MVTLLGWSCAALGSAMSLPQLIRLLRSRTSAGLSLLMWQLVVGAGIGWTIHGLVVGRANLWVPNALLTAMAAMVVWLIARDREITPWRAWALPVMLAAVLIAIDLAFGSLAFGLAITAPQVIGAGAQLVDVVRSIDISGLSPVFIVVQFLVQAQWLVWALIVKEAAVTVAAASNGAVMFVTMVWYFARRAGWVRPLSPDESPESEAYAGGHDF